MELLSNERKSYRFSKKSLDKAARFFRPPYAMLDTADKFAMIMTFTWSPVRSIEKFSSSQATQAYVLCDLVLGYERNRWTRYKE